MFMRPLRCPKPHVLLVDMPTQIKMGFVIKQNQAKIHSFLPYWPQFVLAEFALSMEPTLSHWEWFFAQSMLKCRLP